ncbi:MAG: metal-dependent hydrolase [Planctomycetota bacterium]
MTHGLAGASIAVAASKWTGDGSMQPALVASATIAALLPDLDFLFAIAKKPLLAWRWHRVLLHNLLAVPVLALLAAGCVHPFAGETAFDSLLIVNALALFSHVFLDLLTSFRTGVLFPLSRKRYAIGTHFLTDPIIGMLCGLSLVPSWNAWMLLTLAMYLFVAAGLKAVAMRRAKMRQAKLRLSRYPIHLRPRVFAPWRWMAIIERETQYVFFYLTPLHAESPKTTSRGRQTEAAKLVEKHELLRCFDLLADFPRYEDTYRDGQSAIVVEDIQWWWKLPYRPMAISAVIDADGNPCQARETHKLSKHPTG